MQGSDMQGSGIVAIRWQNQLYGLPGHGHRSCAKEAIESGTYVKEGQLLSSTNRCAKCGRDLLNGEPSQPEE